MAVGELILSKGTLIRAIKCFQLALKVYKNVFQKISKWLFFAEKVQKLPSGWELHLYISMASVCLGFCPQNLFMQRLSCS